MHRERYRLKQSHALASVTSMIVIVLLMFGVGGMQQQAVPTAADTAINYAGMFRVDVDVRDAYDRARIDEAGIVVLSDASDSVRVLVDTMQRAQLARWGMFPYNVVSVAELGVDAPPLARSSGTIIDQYKRSLRVASPQRAWASSLSTRTRLKLAATDASDRDGDGLSDTQEMEWCTNPNLADSDRDGISDKAEIDRLRLWMAHGTDRAPNKGFPFLGTPFMNSDVTGCYDTDQDSIPDFVEQDLGLDSGRESSDGDKYDDGQELYGRTHCTNSGGYCGYGSLPRNSDRGVIMAEMPNYVLTPGNHPVIAAITLPDISVKPGSIRVRPITVITTEKGTITQNERSYAQTQTKGVSVAQTEGKTWNKWQEVSESKTSGRGGPAALLVAVAVSQAKGSALDSLSNIASIVDTGYNIADYYRQDRWRQEDKIAAAEREKVLDQQYDKHMATLEKQVNATNLQTQGNRENTLILAAQHERDTNRMVDAQNGTTFAIDRLGNITANGLRNVTNAILAPRETKSQGSSRGGYVSLTQTQYEENSVTNGESFTTGEDWRTATAVDSSHAADLRFTYTIVNSGTDFVNELKNISFNVYLNDDPSPIHTYSVDGVITNIKPQGVPLEFTSPAIALTLDQVRDLDVSPYCDEMKAQGVLAPDDQCPGGTLRVELNNFAYGDNEAYDADAMQGGVTLRIDDGSDDGDFTLDTYVVPTWESMDFSDEPLLDVLARAFPVQRDADDSLVAIWTPEIRSDIPAWCDSPRAYSNRVYCKRALSTADAWLIYSSGMTGDATSYQRMTAQSGAQALFRFRRDSDKDGYPDEVEDRLGTNKNSARSVPMPELTAAVHQVREGNDVTATLSLLNGGATDAYGVEAVMIAPDDSITVTNNFVGGGGRVKAYEQLSVGSQIDFNPALGQNWTANGHTTPVLAGYYTGTEPRTYTFTARCGGGGTCTVGSGSTAFIWVDNEGEIGILEVGAGYQSPNRMTVGTFGLSVAFLSGVVSQGEQFTVVAAPPLDTFGYTINREPHTPPMVAVTANHTGGWEQTVVPASSMNIAEPNLNLAPYAGNMIYGMDMQILSNTPVKVGSNTTYIAVNNPSSQTIKKGRIYLEVVAPDGYRTAIFEKQLDFVNGPTVVPMTWSTSAFTTTYEADEQFVMRATWTDYQDTIIRKAYRDMSNLGVNNFPKIEVPAGSLTKDLGVIDAGMPAKYSVFIANTGQNSLMLTQRAVEHVQSNLQGTAMLPIGAVGELRFSLDTGNMPAGSFTKSIQIRTSDPLQPLLTVQLSGEIVEAYSDIVAYVPDPYKPLETALYVQGPQDALAPVTYDNVIVTEQARIRPVEVVDDLTGVSLGRGRAVASVWEQVMPYQRSAVLAEMTTSAPVTDATAASAQDSRAIIDSGWVEVCGPNCDFEYGNMYGWETYGGTFYVDGCCKLAGSYALTKIRTKQAYFQRSVSVNQFATLIDAGFGTVNAGAYMKDRYGEDGAISVYFLNAQMQGVGSGWSTGWVSGADRNAFYYYGRELAIPPGTRYIRFRVDAIRTDSGDNADVTVDNVSIRVRMHGNAVGSVVGTVFADLNQNGTRDSGELAVAGAQITLNGSAAVHTDAQGGYQFINVDVGNHTLTITPPTQYVSVAATQRQVSVSLNQQSTMNFGLQPYSSVSGNVYLDTDADGVRDDNEKGVAGIVIAAGNQQTTTDANGNYRVDGLAQGSVTIRIVQSNGYAATAVSSITKNIGLAEAVQVDFGVLNYVAEVAPGSGGATMRMFVPNAIAQSARYVVRNGIEMSFDGPNVTQTTYVTLPNTEYLTVSLEILSIDTLTGNTRVDVGADGSNDWMPSLKGVSRHVNNALANQVNAYRTDKSGDTIDLPIKITSASNAVGGKLLIYNVVAVPKPTVDLSVAGVMIANSRSMSTGRSNASTNVPINTTRYVNATIRNNGTSASEPMSVAAVADVTDFGAWYVGSVLVPALPAKGTYNVSIPFTTQSWEAVTGTMQLLVDPYGGVPESTESNNDASIGFAVYDPSNSGLTPGQLTQTAVSAGQTATAIVRGTQIAENTTATAIVRATNSAIAGSTQTVVAMNSTATAAAQATEKASVNAVGTATAGARQTSVSALAQTKVAMGKTVAAQRQATAAAQSTTKAGIASTKVAAQKTAVAGKMATQRAAATAKANANSTVVSAKQTAVAAQVISKARTATAVAVGKVQTAQARSTQLAGRRDVAVDVNLQTTPTATLQGSD